MDNGHLIWLFAGADNGGEILADAMTVIETAKLAGLNPEAYLADILARFADQPDRAAPALESARPPRRIGVNSKNRAGRLTLTNVRGHGRG